LSEWQKNLTNAVLQVRSVYKRKFRGYVAEDESVLILLWFSEGFREDVTKGNYVGNGGRDLDSNDRAQILSVCFEQFHFFLNPRRIFP